MKKSLLLIALVFLGSCASVRVNYDYQRETDWTAYSTYAFYPDMDTGMNDLDTRRLISAIDEVLREKGFQQAEDPDLLLNLYSQTYRDAPNSNVGVGLGGTGRNVGGGISVGIPVSSNGLKRQITFDLVDAARDELIWQAVSTDGFSEGESPKKRVERFEVLVRKVFARFPPDN